MRRIELFPTTKMDTAKKNLDTAVDRLARYKELNASEVAALQEQIKKSRAKRADRRRTGAVLVAAFSH